MQLLQLQCFQTLPLESPFAWKSESYILPQQIKLFPDGVNLTISFTATRISKFLGYIPVIGTIIGISRILKGIQEYQLFNNTHLHILSNRSVKWIARGVLESIPILGGAIYLIIDIIATILYRNSDYLIPFEDEPASGLCHKCGFR